MRNVMLRAAIAGVLAVAGAAPAAAQDGGRMMAMLFPDPDGDGVTTKAEMDAAAAERFATLDRNKDGKIAGDEMGGQGGRMLARADTDGDGAVSLAEMQAAGAMRFDRMDANHDGGIDKAERDAAIARMQAMRGN